MMNARISRPRQLMAKVAAVTASVTALTLVAPTAAAADIWREQQFWLTEYGVTEAWETTQGEGVTIAVIDTGIDADHPTLDGAVVGGQGFSGGGDSSGSPVDQPVTEHGTLVASLLAGRGEAAQEQAPETDLDELSQQEWDEWFDDFVAGLEEMQGADQLDQELLDEFYETRVFPGSEEAQQQSPESVPTADEDLTAGVVGVAPEAELLSISLSLQDPNPYGASTDEQIADAVTWAVDNGADIINMSISSFDQQWPQSWDEAFLYAEENDVLVVAAAGNRASGQFAVGAPASIPGVLTVAGVTAEGEVSEDSSSQGIAVDLAAASEPLVGALPGGENGFWVGTSGAAPIVSGAAALVMAAHPELSAPEVAHRLTATATGDPEGANDPNLGAGVIDVAAAVNADVPQYNPAQTETLADWIRVHRRAAEDEPTPDAAVDFEVHTSEDGEPRAAPQAEATTTVQSWAGPSAVVISGILLAVFLVFAASQVTRLRGRGDHTS